MLVTNWRNVYGAVSEPNLESKQTQATQMRKLILVDLQFGTAGLRAEMGAGFARMNSLTVIQTSQGLADYLLGKHPDAAVAGVVIGHDARHNSRKFSELAAAAFSFRGIKVWWYEASVHTPLVPFAVATLKAAGGVMITASHNPAKDNGYKVYASNGCQINTPADLEISACIARNTKPSTWNFLEDNTLKEPILSRIKNQYIQSVGKSVMFSGKPDDVPEFVYTPMHGVGLKYMCDALNSTGMTNAMTVVLDQAYPDPKFPTVKFPNPEEKSALDRAIATADKNRIPLILANDPDADRFAVAEKIAGRWHQFTGDQIGVLLGYHCFQRMDTVEEGVDYMLTSTVSSQMLSFIAAEEGFSVAETLTGFKWLGNRTLDLRKAGKRVHFAYEEALGYMFPEVVLDKDGVTTAVNFLKAVSAWGSPYSMLQQLYERYGYFETMNTYWKAAEVTLTKKIFKIIRSHGIPYPKSLGNRLVSRWRDLTIGYDSATADHAPELPTSKDEMITCWLSEISSDQGIRFTIRASGTEPKIKSKLKSSLLWTGKRMSDAN
jgi:phosphoglucomutase